MDGGARIIDEPLLFVKRKELIEKGLYIIADNRSDQTQH